MNANTDRTHMLKGGILTISLDFELYWGIRDHTSLANCSNKLLKVWDVIPETLDLFKQYEIHATWATVGMLFNESIASLKKSLPSSIPEYTDIQLSPYKYLQSLKDNDTLKKCHIADDLIDQIIATNGQELATHTYSHYYCLEAGPKLHDFNADIQQAITISSKKNVSVNSIVFPRNQYSESHLNICKKNGLSCYRGNQKFFAYEASDGTGNSKFKRILRLLDAYINISGYNTYVPKKSNPKQMVNLPASFFLRPYSSRMRHFDWLRLHRIKVAMTNAAKHNKVFHLWWHPHNFSSDIANNIIFLTKIFEHYKYLNNRFNMTSLNMAEICQGLSDDK